MVSGVMRINIRFIGSMAALNSLGCRCLARLRLHIFRRLSLCRRGRSIALGGCVGFAHHVTMSHFRHGLLVAAHWEEPVATASALHLHMDAVAFWINIATFVVHKPDFASLASNNRVESGQGVDAQ